MRNWAIFGLLFLGAIPAFGQAPPFFGGGGTAFDPEVSTVFSGALMDAQAVVSNDRKYVTLNMRATNSRLRTLVTFPVVTADTVNRGFAGGANLGGTGGGGTATGGVAAGSPPAGAAPRGGGAGGAQANTAAPKPPSPDQISRDAKAWVFTRQGIYLVKPLE
jgi:hypothetical protein